MIDKDILVEIGYYDFKFDDVDDALEFAELAKSNIDDGDGIIKVTVTFNKKED